MNLQKLFETQRVLDEHIYDKHPELRGQNNLDWKILALQVELGECANEWRGFKKWSNDQEPRTYVPNPNDLCKACKGQGYTNKHLDIKQWKFCKECDGCGAHFHNPLLEEYVDCLHFILSIGLEMEMQFEEALIWDFENTQDVINLFHEVIAQTADLFWDCKNKYETVGTYKAVLNHFIKLGEELGFDWEQVESAYFAKNRINHERQESGY
ncbi:dUTP diphosphatase [Solibacillus sp. FSL K6-1781]|uniref:dUTP diphosphatase n=1 Tax=Solibacillus sp. FSL K6-1781 TaxID=2921474 RepID=UPI003159C5A9